MYRTPPRSPERLVVQYSRCGSLHQAKMADLDHSQDKLHLKSLLAEQ